MATKTFFISYEAQPSLFDRIAKLNSKAIKLGFPEITYTVGKAYEKHVPIYSNTSTSIQLKVGADVTIEYNYTIKIGNYTLVGIIQHISETESLIISCDDNIKLPDKFYSAKSNCEHCNTYRQRNNTFVCYDGYTFIQVGSSCLKDFLGHLSPEDIVAKASFIYEAISTIDGFENLEDFSLSKTFLLRRILAITDAVINKFGWTSKSKAFESNTTATADIVFDYSTNGDVDSSITVTDENYTKATKVIEWAENLSDEQCCNSDYLHNIRVIARSGFVTKKIMGYACSILAAYEREQQNKIVADSKHFGTIGEKFKLLLTFKKKFTFDSTFGTTRIYLFTDCYNNQFVWKTTTYVDLQEDTSYQVSGSIKDHIVYNNKNQTVITRCKIA